MYGNEQGVGEAVRASGLDRADVFITSKLNNGVHGPTTRAARSRGRSRRSGSDYVDLFLIHWPLPTLYDGDFVSTWKTLEEFKADGRARSIGVSNFQVDAPRAPRGRDRRRARGQPDRAAPVLPQRRGARVRRGARHRDRGVVADRAGRRPRRPGDHRDRRAARAGRRRRSCCAGTSSAAPSSSRSRRRPRGSARTSRSSTSSSSPATSTAIDGARPGRGGPDRRRTRTRSPTSPS